MEWLGWVVLVGAIVVQAFDWSQTDFGFMALIAFYATIGVYPKGAAGALRGFADPGLWTVNGALRPC